MIVPTAKEEKTREPARNMPGHGDDHGQSADQDRVTRGRRGGSQRGLVAGSAGALLALAAQIEQGVVDANGQPDEQDDRVDGAVHRHELRDEPDQAQRAADGGEPEQHRQAGSDQRAEGEQQDGERDRQ